MKLLSDVFRLEREGDTLIVNPACDFSEFHYREIESGAQELLDFLERSRVQKVVVDLSAIDYCGSTALGCFVKLWKTLISRNGQMAFCNVSDHEMEVLSVTRLAGMWPLCATREEALASVGSAADRNRPSYASP